MQYTGFEIYSLFEDAVVKVTIAEHEFVCLPVLGSWAVGEKQAIILQGLNQAGALCRVVLSRDSINRRAQRLNYSTLKLYDADGTRFRAQFFHPVEHLADIA